MITEHVKFNNPQQWAVVSVSDSDGTAPGSPRYTRDFDKLTAACKTRCSKELQLMLGQLLLSLINLTSCPSLAPGLSCSFVSLPFDIDVGFHQVGMFNLSIKPTWVVSFVLFGHWYFWFAVRMEESTYQALDVR